MSLATEVRTETTLAQYVRQLRWVLERKDFNDFWPIGLPWAATAMGSALVERMEAALPGPAPAPVPNPTVALILLLFSTYGMREASWPRARRLAFAGRLLDVIHASKRSAAVDADGLHQLVASALPLQDDAWRPATQRDMRAISRLSATLWAYAEAAYFCNHRIATERHGPYESAPGHLVLVRSAQHLVPRELWPELASWPALPRRIDLCVDYAADQAPFDLFANPLFTFDAVSDARRFAVVIEDARGAVELDPPASRLDAITVALQGQLRRITAVVGRLDACERAERLHRIMLYGLERIGGDRCLSSARADRARDGRPVRGDVTRLVRYYDLREDAAS